MLWIDFLEGKKSSKSLKSKKRSKVKIFIYPEHPFSTPFHPPNLNKSAKFVTIPDQETDILAFKKGRKMLTKPKEMNLKIECFHVTFEDFDKWFFASETLISHKLSLST